MLLDPARRDRAGAGALRRPAAAGARRRRPHRAGAGALPRPPRAHAGSRSAPALVAIGAAIAVGGRAWDQFTSSDARHPDQPQRTVRQPLRLRPQRLLPRRPRRLRRKADRSATAPAPTSSPGTSCATSTCPVHDAHSLYLQALSELGVVGAAAGPGDGPRPALDRLRRLARRRAARSASSTRRSSPPALTFAVGAAIDWFWQIAALGAVFFLASRRPGRRPLRAAARQRAAADGRGEAAAALRARRRRPGARLDRGAGADRAAAGRPRARRQQIGGRRRQTRQRRRPRRDRPLDRALGRLALRPARPAGPGRRANTATAIERLGQAIDREDRNWVLYYLRAKAEHEAGERQAARADLARSARS